MTITNMTRRLIGLNETAKTGMDKGQLARLAESIEADIDLGKYFGAAIIIARGGEVALQRSFGETGGPDSRRLEIDDVFRILSVTKSLTNVLVLQCIDHGLLSFNTRVIDVIPEFLGSDRFRAQRKDSITVAHLLTHTAGLPATPEPLPYDQIGDLSAVVKAVCQMDVISEPGEKLVYSPAINHALLGEMVRRVRGSDTFRDVLHEYLLDPLGMTGTALGVPKGRRVVPIVANFQDEAWLHPADLEALNEAISGDAEIPWVGATSSVEDIFRLAEMLRCGGEHQGTRIVSSAVIDKATINQTGDQPNDLFRRVAESMRWEVGPGYLGLGFPLAGEAISPSIFGTLTSPRTFGAFGAGSTLWWVDPVKDVTFVCLTSGIMAEDANILRFQRLSDMTIAAAN
jgi:CubicO group peptidase (beta-lactamase class C family)